MIIDEYGNFVQRFQGVYVSVMRSFPNAGDILFYDSTQGTVYGCISTVNLGAPDVRSFAIDGLTTAVSRNFAGPGGAPMSAAEPHLGLTWGVPGGGDAMGILRVLGPNQIQMKKITYERVQFEDR